MAQMKRRRPIGFVKWARMAAVKYPDLNLLIHVTNEGKRSRAAAAGIAKAMGLKRGVWDYLLPVRSYTNLHKLDGPQHLPGLWIEMKSPGATLTPEQEWWREEMRKQHYRTEVCFSWDQARLVILDYLGIKEEGTTYASTKLRHAAP